MAHLKTGWSVVDLARDGHSELYLIPFLMLAVLFFGIARAWEDKLEVAALVSLTAGLVSAYLMNCKRVRAEDTSGLIAVGSIEIARRQRAKSWELRAALSLAPAVAKAG